MDILWRKDASGMYTDIVKKKKLREVTAKIERGREYNKKNNEESTRLRMEGDNKLKENDWYDAMLFYNKSLLFAEIDSENISLAIANRSLCFLKLKMYDECLKDIELAINAKYPERLMQELEERRKVCLEQMNNNNSQPMKVIEPKLDFDADENFPGMSNVIKMEYNEKFGRHFIAKCDLEVGKVVMVEKAFVNTAIHFAVNICDSCFRSMANLIACPYCVDATFCNQTCANHVFHKIRCGRGLSDEDDSFVEHVCRSIVRAINIFPNIEELIDFVENVIGESQKEVPHSIIDMQSKYRLFLKLSLECLNSKRVTASILCGSEVFLILMKSPIYQNFVGDSNAERSRRFFMHLCLMHAAIVKCNAFKNGVHGGIFLLRNHFNHSCAPNVLVGGYENKAAIITSRQIRKGDQLFISYNNHSFYKNSLHERQKWLYEKFGFRCKCEKCKNVKWPISSAHIRSDPIYQTLLYAGRYFRRHVEDIPKYIFCKKKCIEVLSKYSDSSWCVEFEMLSVMYQVYSMETLF